MDAAALRAEFPVLERIAYLNAGTDGPLPARGVAAAAQELEREAREGRLRSHFERRGELSAGLREAYAGLLGRPASEVSLTTGTSEGIGIVVDGLQMGAGDEIVTSDQEHPGLLGALQAARELRGVTVTVAPFARTHEAVSGRTRLVATSHVSWVSGELRRRAWPSSTCPSCSTEPRASVPCPSTSRRWAPTPTPAPARSGCAVPTAPGCCGSPRGCATRCAARRRAYGCLAEPGAGLASPLHPDARRYEASSQPAEAHAFALAAHEVLARFGWERVHARARELAAELGRRLADAGREVAAPR